MLRSVQREKKNEIDLKLTYFSLLHIELRDNYVKQRGMSFPFLFNSFVPNNKSNKKSIHSINLVKFSNYLNVRMTLLV